MSFFKRLSRSRSNSQSYVNDDYKHDSKAPSSDYEYVQRPGSSGQQQPNTAQPLHSKQDQNNDYLHTNTSTTKHISQILKAQDSHQQLHS